MPTFRVGEQGDFAHQGPHAEYDPTLPSWHPGYPVRFLRGGRDLEGEFDSGLVRRITTSALTEYEQIFLAIAS